MSGYVGPQNGGTYGPSPDVVVPRPVDAGGGQPGMYGAAILDIFRFGLGVYAEDRARRREAEIARWRAISDSQYASGQHAAFYGGQGQLGILGVAALALIVILAVK